jgi:hypothetical protein
VYLYALWCSSIPAGEVLQQVVQNRSPEERARQLPEEQYGDKLMMEKGDELMMRGEALEDWVEIFIGGEAESFAQFESIEVSDKMVTSTDVNRYPERESEACVIDAKDRDLVSARSNSKRPSFDGAEMTKQTQLFYTPVLQENPLRYAYRRQDAFLPNERVLFVVTMYNETEEEFRGTLEGLSLNLEYIRKHGSTLGFGDGEDGYKDFLVCIVADGESKASESSLEYGHALGIYDEQVKLLLLLSSPLLSSSSSLSLSLSLSLSSSLTLIPLLSSQGEDRRLARHGCARASFRAHRATAERPRARWPDEDDLRVEEVQQGQTPLAQLVL